MVYHLLHLGWSYLLSQFLGSRQQVLLRNEAFAVLVEVLKDTADVLLSIGVARSDRHQFDELLEGDLAAVVCVEDRHGHVDEGPSRLVAAVVADGLTQVHGSQHAVVVVVQEVEDLLEDLNIVDGALSDHVLLGVEGDIALHAEGRVLSLLRRVGLAVLAFPETAAWPSSHLRTARSVHPI